MIDIVVYRFRVGVFNANKIARYFKNINICNRKRNSNTGSTGSIFDHHYFFTTQKHFYISSILFIMYMLFIIFFLTLSLLILLDMNINSDEVNPNICVNFLSTYGPNSAYGLKSLYLIFIFVIIQSINNLFF